MSATLYPMPQFQSLGIAIAAPANGVLGDFSNGSVTATSSTTARTLATRAADEANVLDFGADPTGVADSTPAFVAALATKRNVYAPGGNYRLTNSITVGDPTYAQRLRGHGAATVLQVDYDFSSSALGVIIIGARAFNGPGFGSNALISNEIMDLTVSFKQPPDIQTTAAAIASAGSSTITIASSAGIVVGMTVVDHTNYDALSNAVSGGNPYFTLVTVAGVAGTTITLSSPVKSPGVSSGDTLYFGATRAMYKPLGTGTTTQGGTGVQYPWAIYSPSADMLRLSGNVFISGAWNGVYIRGASFRIGSLLVGALNVGFDVDGCHNFSYVKDYQFQAYGIGANTATDTGQARVQSFYDGTTVSANIGALDGGKFDSIQSWTGIVNLTSTFTWAEVDSIALDGNSSALNIAAGSSGTAWLQIGNLYKSCGLGQATPGILLNGFSGFKLMIGTIAITSAASAPIIQITSGGVSIASGTIYHGGPASGIELDGDHLVLGPVQFLSQPQSNLPYIKQTAGWLSVTGSVFAAASSTNQPAISITDNAANVVRNIGLNGWTMQGIPATPLGYYSGFERASVYIGTGSGPAGVTLNGGGGGDRTIHSQSVGVTDWQYGENGGKDWVINRWTGGASVGNPVVVRNATGNVEIANTAANPDTAIGNQAGIATSATTGFLYVPMMVGGSPAGTPVNAATLGCALCFDRANSKLWVWNNGNNTWKGVVLT